MKIPKRLDDNFLPKGMRFPCAKCGAKRRYLYAVSIAPCSVVKWCAKCVKLYGSAAKLEGCDGL